MHTDWHGICICPRATSPTPAITPHLQVNVSHPLEHPLVGPDHGVYVLCLTAGPALLESLWGGRMGQLWGPCGDHTGSEGPWCWQGPRHASARDPGQIIHSCSSHVRPFLLGNGEKPASRDKEPRGRATCLQSVGPGGALGSCLVCVAQTPPAWFLYPSPAHLSWNRGSVHVC